MNEKELFADRSQRICNHSPDNFNWGYAGSGPAQLALAILLEFTTEKNATTLYQEFKHDLVSKWPKRRGTIISFWTVKRWLQKQDINSNEIHDPDENKYIYGKIDEFYAKDNNEEKDN
jgi:hypothetical protein